MILFTSEHLRLEALADDVAALVLDRCDSPWNFFDPELLDEVAHALDVVAQAPAYRLLLIRSGKTGNFCHGPPFRLLAGWQKEDYAAWAQKGQQVCARLAALTIPSVAVIAGSCLDAGLEFALACDYRVVVNHASAALGFPELEWGMIPCWGGTQRLPHLVGLENSLSILLGNARLGAAEAWEVGLADELAEQGGDPPSFLAHPLKRDWSAFSRRNWREDYVESHRLGRWFLLRGAEHLLRRRLPDEMPAPLELLEALRVVYRQPGMHAGCDFERQALARIAAHPALDHSLRLLQQREKLRTPSTGAKMRMRRVGILGSELRGLWLVMAAASAGHEVVLRAQDRDALARAMHWIMLHVRTQEQRGTLTATESQRILHAIRGTYTWTNFGELDLVLDTEAGSLAEKQALFREVEKKVPPTTILVAAAHTCRVEEIRSSLQRPVRLSGMRIIEPWKREGLTEIVGTDFAAESVGKQVRDWAISLGEFCLEVPDRLGGVAMRVWLPALNEAGRMLGEGVPIQAIDEAMRRFGMSHGPLEWMDRLGLNHVASSMRACQSLFAGRIAFEPGFSNMAEKGWLGIDTDVGFYRNGKPHRAAERLWQLDWAIKSSETQSEIQKRLVMLTVLEAVRCMEEGSATDTDDLNCALCLTGWATHRGGPIGYARQLGFTAVAAACAELEQEHGSRFALPAATKAFLS